VEKQIKAHIKTLNPIKRRVRGLMRFNKAFAGKRRVPSWLNRIRQTQLLRSHFNPTYEVLRAMQAAKLDSKSTAA
jgi:hypothetical protein